MIILKQYKEIKIKIEIKLMVKLKKNIGTIIKKY